MLRYRKKEKALYRFNGIMLACYLSKVATRIATTPSVATNPVIARLTSNRTTTDSMALTSFLTTVCGLAVNH